MSGAVAPIPTQVFVDDSGRRGRWARMVGIGVTTLCAAYMGIVVVGLSQTAVGPLVPVPAGGNGQVAGFSNSQDTVPGLLATGGVTTTSKPVPRAATPAAARAATTVAKARVVKSATVTKGQTTKGQTTKGQATKAQKAPTMTTSTGSSGSAKSGSSGSSKTSSSSAESSKSGSSESSKSKTGEQSSSSPDRSSSSAGTA